MPLTAKVRAGSGKGSLKRAALARLPKDLVHAPKWGFAVNRDVYREAAWLLRDGMARELLEWSAAITDQLMDELLSAAKPVVLFSALSLDLWGRIFLRGESSAELGERMAHAHRDH